jgi:hypothetical protein
VDGIDRNVCPIIQDDLSGNEHVTPFQFLRQPVDRFDGDLDDKIQVLGRARFAPCPFCDGAANQIFNSGSVQGMICFSLN